MGKTFRGHPLGDIAGDSDDDWTNDDGNNDMLDISINFPSDIEDGDEDISNENDWNDDDVSWTDLNSDSSDEDSDEDMLSDETIPTFVEVCVEAEANQTENEETDIEEQVPPVNS